METSGVSLGTHRSLQPKDLQELLSSQSLDGQGIKVGKKRSGSSCCNQNHTCPELLGYT